MATAKEQLAAEGFTGTAAELTRSANLHYQGQTFELTVPVPDGAIDRGAVAAIEEAFGREHERTYGHRAGPDEPVELVTILVTGHGTGEQDEGAGAHPLIARPNRKRSAPRQAYFGPQTGWLATPVVGRSALSATARPGPLIVEEYDATCLVPPNARAMLDTRGNIVIELRSPVAMEGERNIASPAPDLRGADRHAVDTPALLVDLDLLDANIARIAATCRKHGIAWRPHTKGIKVPAIAHRLLGAGASGVTCAKLGEAEVMAAAGIGDIMIANQIVGAQKIARLVASAPSRRRHRGGGQSGQRRGAGRGGARCRRDACAW